MDDWKAQRHQAVIADAVEYLEGPECDLLDSGLRHGLLRYLQQRLETGSFLRACLENNFFEAVSRMHPTLGIETLRKICELNGDNDWKDNLYIPDILEKHLWKYLEQ